MQKLDCCSTSQRSIPRIYFYPRPAQALDFASGDDCPAVHVNQTSKPSSPARILKTIVSTEAALVNQQASVASIEP